MNALKKLASTIFSVKDAKKLYIAAPSGLYLKYNDLKYEK